MSTHQEEVVHEGEGEVVHEGEGEEGGNEKKKRASCCCCSRLTGLFITGFIVSCICLVTAVGFGVTYDLREDLLYFVANKELSLTRGSPMTTMWVNLPAANSIIYFFNITNPHDVQHKGAKPNLEEIGPFYYKKKRNVSNLFWNQDESLLSYSTRVTYTDDLVQSIDDPRDVKVTSLNIPLIALFKLFENIETKYKEWKPILEAIFGTEDWFNEVLNYEPLFITKTIEELSFGYEDPIYKLVHELDPSLLPNANFSLQSKDKVEKYNTVYTGKNDSLLRDQFVIWNGLHEISGWDSPTARMINGTDAVMFHTNISRTDNVTAFTKEFQRSAYFTYNSDEYVGKLLSYRYMFPSNEMNTSLMDPGFNPDGPSGVFNLSAVAPFNVPLFLSKPHFLDADKQFLHNVTGLSPNRTLHDSFLNVEPITGITVKGAKRIQINVQIDRKRQFVQLGHLRDLTVLPVFYVIDEAQVTDAQADFLHNILNYIQGSLNIGLLVIIGLAGVVFILTFVCQLVLVIKMRKRYIKKRSERKRRTARPSINEQTPLLQ